MTTETRRSTVRALVAVVPAVAADNGGARVEVPRGGEDAPAVTARTATGDVTVRPASRLDRS